MGRFQSFDLNGDTLQDLLVYDRMDNRLMPFLRKPKQLEDKERQGFEYAPRYRKEFPTHLFNDYIIARDFDSDGDLDIFTNNNSGIRVIENITPDTATATLDFRVEQWKIRTDYGGGIDSTILTIGGSTYPGLKDIDFDGDLDLLTYNITGTRIEWHKNEAIENLGRKDTMDMRLVSECWGHFYEWYNAGTNTFNLVLEDSATCNETPKTAHSGGAIKPINLNGDTLMDCLVSDAGINVMAAGYNGGTRDIANIVEQDTAFPMNTQKVNLTTFPISFQIDADGDGDQDLIFTPNGWRESQDRFNAHYYENIGSDSLHDYSKRSESFLVSEMVDVGSEASTAYFDYNGDNKPDLVVANNFRRNSEGQERSGLSLYRNVGTRENPHFELKTDDFLGFYKGSSLEDFEHLRPAFGDIDLDGDKDLLIGTKDGALWRFDNQPAGGNADFTKVDNNFLQQSFQPNFGHANPLFYDWDQDGDEDLLIGSLKGRIWYYEQQGSSGQPNFVLQTKQLGNIRVNENNPTHNADINPEAHPSVFDIDFDQEDELLVSNKLGHVFVYDSLSTDPTATLDSVGRLPMPTEYPFSTIRPYPVAHGDSAYFFTGTEGGGLMLHEVGKADTVTDTPTPSAKPVAQQLEEQIKIYPNPARHAVQVQVPADMRLRLKDMRGRLVLKTKATPGADNTLQLNDLAPGIYNLQLYNSHHSVIRRISIKP
jgi:hypothetical protein